MLHFIRLNVVNQGYSVFQMAGHDKSCKFLDSETDAGIDYSTVAKHLDAFLDQSGGSTLAASRTRDGSLIFGYSLRLPAQDQYGRHGLTLLHALSARDASVLPEVTLAALSHFTAVGIDGLTRRIESVAKGDTPVEFFIKELVSEFEQSARKHSNRTWQPPKEKLIGSVIHDCGGGSTRAWLTLARQQSQLEGPWLISDRMLEGGLTTTTVSPGTGLVMTASALFLQDDWPPAQGLEKGDTTGVGTQESPAHDTSPEAVETSIKAAPKPEAGTTKRRSGWSRHAILLVSAIASLLLASVALVGQAKMPVKLLENRLRSLEEQHKELEIRIEKQVNRKLASLEGILEKPRPEALALSNRLTLLPNKPSPRQCASEESLGMAAVQVDNKMARLYVCGPDGWLLLVGARR